MEKFTRDFIFALKLRSEESIMDRAIGFMSERTNTPKEYYYPGVMLRIARQKFLDYLSSADHPNVDISNYFEIEDLHDSISETDAILSVMSMVRVRGDNGEYVNGFWEDLCE